MNSYSVTPLEQATIPKRHGDKAANLARVLEAGLPSPPGFVLDIEILSEQLEQLGLAERTTALFASLESDSEGGARTEAIEIQRCLLDGALPLALTACLEACLADGVTYAVRSSAPGEDGIETSFAGQFDSVLDCQSVEDVERAVRRVWASLFSERAVQYMRHRRHRPSGMAVLIQHQVDAMVSGVMFTRNPRRPDSNDLLLEYCTGLGEGLVSGQLTPGRLTIDRDSGAIREEQPLDDAPPTLNLPELGRVLHNLALRLEALFGSPQDVEWSLDRKGQLYVLQSRPITAMAAVPAGVVWTNANIAENFPDPVCPLLRSFVDRGYTAYFRSLGRAFGISKHRMTTMSGALGNLVGCHGGRLYYNLSNIHAVIQLAPGGPWLVRYFNQFTGAREFPDLARTRRGLITGAAELVGVVFRVVYRYLHVRRGVRQFEADVDAYAAASRPEALPAKSLPQLADLLKSFLHIRLERWTGAALADTAAMVCYGVLGALLRGLPGADANDLLKGLPGLASAAPVERLWELSRALRADPALRALFTEATADEILASLQAGEYPAFQDVLNAYCDTWGFRSSGELMLSRPTPREDPLPLLKLLASYVAQNGDGPAEVSRRQAELRRQSTRETRRQLGFWRGLVFNQVLRATQGAIRLRERARMKQALLYTRLRHVALALGDVLVRQGRLEQRDDVLFLKIDEAIAEAGKPGAASLRQTVAKRRAELEAAKHQYPPDSFTLPEGAVWQPGLAEAPSAPGGGELSGTGACGGRARGHAAVVLDVTEIGRIRPDQILVTRQTDPGWAAVFFMIKGLVIERGGLLSHGAIIAREYGIPAVVGVRNATRLIADGDAVCVDGDQGRVDHVLH